MNRTLTLAATCAGLALAVSGCGGSNPSAAGQYRGQNGGHVGRQYGGGFGGLAGGTGKVAAVSGSTAQVQNQQGQVAVTWTSATKFSRQAATTAAAVKVGSCVMVVPATTPSGTTRTPRAAGAPVTAGSVRVSAPVKGSCAGVLGGGRGGRGGFPSGRPSDAPPAGTGGPGDRQRGFGGFGAFGAVTAVSGSGFTVVSEHPGTPSSGSSDSPESSTAAQVTTTSRTTYITTQTATAAVVKVGQCLVSRGRPDSTGAITATSITVSTPVNGQCASGFGGFGRHDGAGGRPGGTTAQGQA